MPRILPSYLRTLRLQWGLSQSELARLLGISASLLSKVESLDRRPTARVIVPAEIVFGLGPEEIFPGAYRDIEKEVGQRAKLLRDRLKHRSDWASLEKARQLQVLLQRIARAKQSA